MSKGYTIYVRAWSADEYPERDIAKGYVTNVHLRQEYISPETARVLSFCPNCGRRLTERSAE